MIISGLVRAQENYETGDGLYVGEAALAASLAPLNGRRVSARYAFSGRPIDPDDLSHLLTLETSGPCTACFEDEYDSEGEYIRTVQQAQISDVDLVWLCRRHLGRYACLIVEESGHV